MKASARDTCGRVRVTGLGSGIGGFGLAMVAVDMNGGKGIRGIGDAGWLCEMPAFIYAHLN
jgi:hypothetical protein